jgi:hypothetical protein
VLIPRKHWLEAPSLCGTYKQKWFDFICQKNGVSEIVIASQETAGITVNYQQWCDSDVIGKLIREYTQVYEVRRIAYRYNTLKGFLSFPFSRNNHNKLYLSTVRIIEIGLSLLGLVFACFNALYCIGMPLIIGEIILRKSASVRMGLHFNWVWRMIPKVTELFFPNGDTRVTTFGNLCVKPASTSFPIP